MRSGKEILFRIRQELHNAILAASPPDIDVDCACPFPALPSPRDVRTRLNGTPFLEEIVALAKKILNHELPLFGSELKTGAEIAWRRDPHRNVETRPIYFRRIPYLDVDTAGDHKIIWELNRHQHLVLLAQAFSLTGDGALLREIERQFVSWEHDNPYQRGINWTSALEVGFRALSWIWILHLAGEAMTPAFRRGILRELYRHGKHLENNLSIYFSPNTHLLGEAVALHALGKLIPQFPDSQTWTRVGALLVEQQLDRQVREDGSHFEQSSYYQVYALDMFMFHGLLAGASEAYRARIAQMADYLSALQSPSGVLPFIGDDDGGRFFYPYGERRRFARATLATCSIFLNHPEWLFDAGDLNEQAAWWLISLPTKPPAVDHKATGDSTLFPQAGVAVMRSPDVHVVADAGEFGAGSGGHSHSDTLSIIVSAGAEEILIDPGTYTYVGDRQWRDRFRGSAAHNTIRIDGRDQAIASDVFGWVGKPRARLLEFRSGEARDYLDAECEYGGFRHRRRCVFVKPHRLFILDEVDGAPGAHVIEQFWHPGESVRQLSGNEFMIGTRGLLALSAPDVELSWGGELGWRSLAFAEKREAPLIRVKADHLPARLAAVLDLSGSPGIAPEEKLFLELLDLGVASNGTKPAP